MPDRGLLRNRFIAVFREQNLDGQVEWLFA